MPQPLREVVSGLLATDSGDSRVAVAFDAFELIDAASLTVAEKMLESILELQQESEKDSRFRFGPDKFDQLEPEFRKLDQKQRESVIISLCGEIGHEVVAAWNQMADFPYCESSYSPPFRCPSIPAANLQRRFSWLKEILSVLFLFPAGMVTPEWLAVHASGIRTRRKTSFAKLLGALGDGDLLEDDLGTLLGAVIAGDGPHRESVYETLATIARGDHPVADPARYLFRAFWRSGQWRCYEMLVEYIELMHSESSEAAIDFIATVLHASRESGPEAMAIALGAVVSRRLLGHRTIALVLGSWLSTKFEDLNEDERYASATALLNALREPRIIEKAATEENMTPSKAKAFMWAQAFEDVTDVAEIAEALLKSIDPAVRISVAESFSKIEFPANFETCDQLRLRLLKDENLEVALTTLLCTGSISQFEHEQIVPVIETLESRLPGHDKQLVSTIEESTPHDVRQKLVELMESHLDQMSTASFLNFYGRVFKVLYPNAAYKERLENLVIENRQQRDQIVDLIKVGHAYYLTPVLSRSGFEESDRQWLLQLFVREGMRGLNLKTILDFPEETLNWVLAELSQSKEKASRVTSCEMLLSIATKREIKTWACQILDSLLTDRLVDVRSKALHCLQTISDKGLHREYVAETVVGLPTRKKLSRGDESFLNRIRKTLPGNLVQKAIEKLDIPESTSHQIPEPTAAIIAPKAKPESLPDQQLVAGYMKSLADFVQSNHELHAHVKTPFTSEYLPLPKVKLYNFVTSGYREFQQPNESFPHADVWLGWYEDPAQAKYRETGLPALLFANAMPNRISVQRNEGLDEAARSAKLPFFLDEAGVIPREMFSNTMSISNWIALQNPTIEAVDVFLDRFESILASVPSDYWQSLIDPAPKECRKQYSALGRVLSNFESQFNNLTRNVDADKAKEQFGRAQQLFRFIDRPLKGVPRRPPSATFLAKAFESKAANKEDLADLWNSSVFDSQCLATNTATRFRFQQPPLAGHRGNEYQSLIDDYVKEIIDVLLDKKSDRTETAIAIGTRIRSVRGNETLLRLLKWLGKKKLKRRKSDNQTKVHDLVCQLIFYSIPNSGETSVEFSDSINAAMESGWLTRTRLVELAIYAPQWAGWIEQAINCEGLQDAACWLTGHADKYLTSSLMPFVESNITFDPQESVFAQLSTMVTSNKFKSWLAERSSVSQDPLVCKEHPWIIHARWFHHARAAVEDDVWTTMIDSLSLILTTKECQRLNKVISALSGELQLSDLERQINEEDPETDAIQLAAVIPISQGDERLADLAKRVRLIQLHSRKAKRLKTARRDTVMAANERARETLARVTGIEDADRLDWYAMSDLHERISSLSPAEIENTTLELVIQPNGQPRLLVESEGKKRKTIPKAIGKHEPVVALKALEKELKADAKQAAKSIEAAMLSAASFETAELLAFLDSPLLGPPFSSVVFSDGQTVGLLKQESDSLILEDPFGKMITVEQGARLFIPHAADLLEADCLAQWREAFADRVQVIDQVHRELFKPTQQELKDGHVSRFANFEVREKQARRIFESMGWRTERFFGPCWYSRTSRKDKLVAHARLEWVGMNDLMSITKIEFGSQALADVDWKFFSESIRQVNQIVSTAGSE